MKIESPSRLKLAATAIGVVLLLGGLAGCSAELDPVALAEAKVTRAEEALADAQSTMDDASETFCEASETYIVALDRYGDVLNDTAPTVGDVKTAGTDLAEPRDDAFEGAEAALDAQAALVAAQQDLVDAQAELEQAKAGPSASPADPATVPPPAPLVPPASVERVEQGESEFDAAVSSVTDDTPLDFAAEQFNAAAVALEVSWLRLFADAGCLPDEQKQVAVAAVSAYTAALQQSLTTAGFYAGAVDGVYGPQTVAAVEALQTANGLPVTGTVDKATAEALQAALEAVNGAASQESVAATAALQQTLKLCGFWDGPVDGIWTPALTDAVKAFQVELGVEPTGVVDAATVAAFEKAIADLTDPEPEPEPSETPEG
jgi:hypothetical protein